MSHIVIILISIILLLFFGVFLLFIIRYTKSVIRHNKELHKIELETEIFKRTEIIKTQEAEIRRIGNNIHDDIGPTLMAIKMKTNRLIRELGKPNDQHIELLGMIQNCIQDVRGISHSLYPQTLESLGLEDAIADLAERIHNDHNIEVNYKFEPKFGSLPPASELALYRIIQEFCNNSIKHSECDEIRLLLDKVDHLHFINLADNGTGFDVDHNQRGLGLKSMKMRAELGDFDFKLKSDSTGTYIELKARFRHEH